MLAVLTGQLGDEVEVLVEVKDGQPREFGGGRDEVWDGGARWWPWFASRSCTSSAQSSIAGVKYSTGIIEIGGVRIPSALGLRSAPSSRPRAG